MSKHGPHPLPETIARKRLRKVCEALVDSKALRAWDRSQIDMQATVARVRVDRGSSWQTVAVLVDASVPEMKASILAQLKMADACS